MGEKKNLIFLVQWRLTTEPAHLKYMPQTNWSPYGLLYYQRQHKQTFITDNSAQ